MKKLLALTLISSSAFASGEYIVKLKDGANLNKSFVQARSLNVSVGNFAVISTDNKSDIVALSNDPAVEYIEPNFTYTTMGTDSAFDKQWGLKNTGKNSGSWWNPGKKGVDIKAVEAWAITKGSKEVKIAVIDTGVDYTHNDLKKNIMVNEAEKNGKPGVDDDGNGYIDDVYGYDFANGDADPMDGHGHGTHCAGVIGASHDGQGIMGVNANVKILPIKFLTDSGSGSLEGAIKSIDYAISRGVQVMSNSWGGGGRSEALLEVIQKAHDAGISFVAAAGNSRNDNDAKPSYPASYKVDSIISVGALDGKGKKASFSNYGKNSVHVFAPGVDIYSTVHKNGYKKMSGTSMACPHVAGVVGLLLAHEKSMTAQEIKERLISTSDRESSLESVSVAGGYVNALNALR